MNQVKQDIKSLLPEELKRQLVELGEKPFRTKQVFTWLHRGVTSFEQMTDLSKGLREKLDAHYYITAPTVERKQQSQEDGTIKYLWRLRDGNCVETVLMRYNYGNTVCISTEVGCAMGCAFCASTIGGLIRNLEPSEMLNEVGILFAPGVTASVEGVFAAVNTRFIAVIKRRYAG